MGAWKSFGVRIFPPKNCTKKNGLSKLYVQIMNEAGRMALGDSS